MSFPTLEKTQASAEITDLYIHGMDGSTEALNEFLDFTVDKVPAAGLHKIHFISWQASVGELEPSIPTLLATKCSDI